MQTQPSPSGRSSPRCTSRSVIRAMRDCASAKPCRISMKGVAVWVSAIDHLPESDVLEKHVGGRGVVGLVDYVREVVRRLLRHQAESAFDLSGTYGVARALAFLTRLILNDSDHEFGVIVEFRIGV